jgi:SH3-like domain-containing protein
MREYMWLWVIMVLAVGLAPVRADDSPKLPRFASLSKDEIFVRTGPSLQYPIRWVYQKKGLPVEIIREYDTWRQIRDIDGGEGWVHHAMLSGARHVIVQGKDGVDLKSLPEATGTPVVHLEKGVIATLNTCKQGWCEATLSGFTGWAPRAALWGIYAGEQID